MSPLDPSDIALIFDLVVATVLALYFALGRPRTWFLDRLGWVIFGYSVAVTALLALIVYGIVFDQRVSEPVRFTVGAGLALALLSKTWSVYRERREGRTAGTDPASTERIPMSLKKVTEIWYKAQRVLRTTFTTVLTVLPLVPQVIAVVQGQWDAAWLGPVAVQAVAINAALTGIIALPTVNAWLTKIGLGSVPKGAVYTSPATGTIQVKTDPKLKES